LVVEDAYEYRDRQAWRDGIRALALFPLWAHERPLGVLVLAARQGPHPFSAEERSLVRAVSDQLGLAVENARLQAESRQRAIIEERTRLARDLHDSVAQALYGAALYAEATARHLAAGDTIQAAQDLQVLREMAQESLREMRLLVFELRPSLLLQEGLVGALQSRLDAVEGRGGLVTEFETGGTGRLSPEIEEGFYFVAREALNNILRHANARRIRVNLSWDAAHALLEVSDDGIGFDRAATRQCGGMGLQNMEERAARLGGRLTIEGGPGRGTLVRLEVMR
jgi:signal transduction histidine kinase